MAEVVRELLNGGLVTARDPALLLAGELQACEEFVYQENNPAPTQVAGRTTFGAPIGSGPVKGLVPLPFHGVDDQVVAFDGVTLSAAPVAEDTGTFTSLVTFPSVTGTETVQAASYNNTHYLFTGTNDNQRIGVTRDGVTLAARAMGLHPVLTAPTVTTTAGVWSASDVFGVGWYWFLAVEAVHPGETDEVISTFLGDPVQIEIPDLATSLVVTKPPTVNADATHWILYMSPRQADVDSQPPLSSFAQVMSPVAISTSSLTVGGSRLQTGLRVPTVATDVTPDTWTNSSLATQVADGQYMSVQRIPTGPTIVQADLTKLGLTAADLGGVGGTIIGIRVGVIGYFTDQGSLRGIGMAPITVELVKGGTPSPASSSVTFERTGGVSIVFSGGPADLWGQTWTVSDIVDNSFGVRLTYHPSQTPRDSDQTIYVDGVTFQITFGSGFVLTLGDSFPTISVPTDAGVTLEYGAYLNGPRATTGAFFNGSLVTNDTADGGALSYSLPLQPEYFPTPFRLTFPAGRGSLVCLRTLGDMLIAGLQNALMRVNFLPSSNEVFQSGAAFDVLASDHGIVGPAAACTFDLPGSGTMLAYVSYNGVHMTDGVTTTTLNGDLDWQATVDVTQLNDCVLVNYPKRYVLILYYTPPGADHHTKALYFHYHPSVRKEGTLTATRVTVGAASAAVVYVNGVPRLLTGHAENPAVYIEDNGTTDTSGLSATPLLTTRRMYFAGTGKQVRMNRWWVALRNTTGDLTVRLTGHDLGQGNHDLEDETVMPTFDGLWSGYTEGNCEAFEMTLVRDGLTGTCEIPYLAFDLEDYGRERHAAGGV